MITALLALGADIGDPVQQLGSAERSLLEAGCLVQARSRDHWTTPWGFTGQGLFLNRALLVETDRPPLDLMHLLLRIETDHGRQRSGPGYSSRLLDMDILLLEDRVIEGPELTVPHPLMHLREFVLAPAADVAPLTRHPILGRTILDLLNDLRHPGADGGQD